MSDKVNLKVSIDVKDLLVAGLDSELAKVKQDPVKFRILEAARMKLQTGAMRIPDGVVHIDSPHVDSPHIDVPDAG
jgi:hypothetical protein